MKDNFSIQSPEYAKFRPSYPDEVFDFILSFVPDKEKAWDCGTGNGQVAVKLAESFKQVFATDISVNQLNNAVQRPNISYSVAPAEKASFPDNQFDLVTVAQAIHWFDFDSFYHEVRRTAKKDAIIAVFGYSLIKIDPGLDKVMFELYNDILGNYWDKERKYIDEEYSTIPFPFKEIKAPECKNIYHWEFHQLVGYLNTWSAVQHFQKRNGKNPVDLLQRELRKAWGRTAIKKISFPILLRIGRI